MPVQFPTEPKRVGVVGGGIMGQGIAALAAGLGLDVTLFDVSEAQAKAGLEKLGDPDAKLKQLTTRRHLKKIKAAAIESYPKELPACDLIVEAVPEILSLKKKVFAAIDEHRRPGSIVATNTSGLSIRSITEGRSADFKACFLATHYFHPVRYLPLVELIALPETAPGILEAYAVLLRKAGKKPVIGRDTPNFIANRVGVHAMTKTMLLAKKYGFGVELVDLVTGPPLGNPKTASFRLSDMVGIDTLTHAAQNSYDNCPDDEVRAELAPPELLKKLVELKRLGEKTGSGFYKKAGKDIEVLNLETLEYEKKQDPKADAVRVAKGYSKAGDRIRALVELGDDPVSAFARELVLSSGAYALNRVGEVCDDIGTLDDSMRWGFGRDLGPIQALDAIGLERAAELMGDHGIAVPKLLQAALPFGSFYGESKQGQPTIFEVKGGRPAPVADDPRVISTARVRRTKGVVRENLNARLLDLGDGVLLFEPDVSVVPNMNPIDDHMLAMLEQGHEECASGRFKALVIGNQAPNFCAGANLKRVLELAKARRTDVILAMARTLQELNLRGYHAPYPVVAAPHGMTLGGGLELALGAQVRVLASELYCGLVEVGVGLVPAGGGCLRLLQLQGKKKNKRGGALGPMQNALAAFDLIGFAKVSGSAHEAQEMGLVEADDVVVASKDEQLRVAKEVALARLKDFKPKPAEPVTLQGLNGYLVVEDTVKTMVRGGKIGPHAAKIALIQGRILTGGAEANMAEPVSEERVLELEREAFVELCLEPATQARMEHMLKTGKPLFN